MRSSPSPILPSIAFGAAMLLTCCSFLRDADAQQFTAQIIGGRLSPSLVNGPVALVYTGAAVCSGVLVGSQTVLTAGHCSSDSSAIDSYRIVVGGGTYRVAALVAHPLFDLADNARLSAPYDVGIIELSASPSVDPLPVFIDRPVTRGTQLTIAGYGTHESSADASTPAELAKVGRSVVDSVSQDGIIFEQHSGGAASTCPGDSGGPAILRESGYSGVVGILSIGTNEVVGDNCMLANGGRFGHVYLQSNTIRQFLADFPDIQYISGYRIFIESAARSSISTLRRASRTSSLLNLSRNIRIVISSVSKAREYANEERLDLLSDALRELRAGTRSRRLAKAKAKVRAAVQHLSEVVALGIS